MMNRITQPAIKLLFLGLITTCFLILPYESHSEIITTLADDSTERTITFTGPGHETCYLKIPFGSIVNKGYVYLSGDILTDLTSEVSHYLDIGDDNIIEWRHWGEFLTKEVSPDLSRAIEVYLFGHPAAGVDVLVPLAVYTQSEDGGDLKISDIHIDVSLGHTEQISLKPGLNMFVFPIQDVEGFNSFHLLSGYLSPDKASSVWGYNPETNSFQVIYWQDGQVRGETFDILDTCSYLIYMHDTAQINFVGRVKECIELGNLSLRGGLNLINLCPPRHGYTSYDLLKDLGPEVLSVSVYDKNQSVKTTYWTFEKPAGNPFLIQSGVGYLVYRKQD